MSGRAALALALVSAAVGFWAGSTTSESTERAQRTSSRLSPEAIREVERIQTEATRRMRENRKQVAALQKRIAEAERRDEPPSAETAAPGTRLPDGTIVGGAKWNASFHRLTTGFLDSILSGFIRQADLSPEQERRVRSLILKESERFIQVSAEFTNGDIDGEGAYAQLEALGAELRGKVADLLNEEQRANFGKLQGNIRGILRQQIVHNEMAALKSDLGLDSDQEKKVLAIVEQRYTRVQEGIEIPIPNVFFKPLRRERDAPIYKETADAIRDVLSAGQRATFDLIESKAPEAVFDYRTQLVPK